MLSVILSLLTRSWQCGALFFASAWLWWSRWVPYLIVEDRKLGVMQDQCPQTDSEGRPLIWLSFDDGPGPQTIPIVKLLNAHGYNATFFIIGEQLAKFEQKSELEQLLSEGGHSVANHSWSHPNFIPLGTQDTAQEIDQTQVLLKKTFPELVVDLFRPPFGYRSRLTLETAEQAGLTTVVWSLNSLDFLSGPTKSLANRVSSLARGGDILLFHDGRKGRERTLQALQMILPELQNRGFRAYSPR